MCCDDVTHGYVPLDDLYKSQQICIYSAFDMSGGSWVNHVLFKEQIVYLEIAWKV